MLRVVEAFSGIGSQAKALENLYIDHEIVYTVDWDVNAIIAYDLIHNGKQNTSKFDNKTKEELLNILKQYTLSLDGKKPLEFKQLNKYNEKFLRCLCAAIDRSHNLVSITDVKGSDLPNDIDLLTYSFPCQDLSVAGYWHGNKSGIDRNANNRSGMLWEVERILLERQKQNLMLPKMLLMENVSNILANRNIENFRDWQNSLSQMGYYNEVFTLNAANFGIPQKRVRTYMLSVLCNTKEQKDNVEKFFFENNLERHFIGRKLRKLKEFIKLDYRKKKYKEEADSCQANNTPSRIDIYNDNVKILEKGKVRDIIVPTVTTKQDRHPNSGVIDYDTEKKNKCKYRFLTPRECFLLMGFEEKDYDILLKNQMNIMGDNLLFSKERLYKLAGNSIVVNVLEEIFKQVDYINNNILIDEKEKSKIEIIKEKYKKLVNYNDWDYEDI